MVLDEEYIKGARDIGIKITGTGPYFAVPENPQPTEEEKKLVVLRQQFADLVSAEEHAEGDELNAWHLYEEIYNAEQKMADEEHRKDRSEIANLMQAVETGGGYHSIHAAEHALKDFKEATFISPDGTQNGSLVSNITFPYKQDNARKFLDRMARDAQKAINNALPLPS